MYGIHNVAKTGAVFEKTNLSTAVKLLCKITSSDNWDVAVHKVKLLTMLYRATKGFCSLVSF